MQSGEIDERLPIEWLINKHNGEADRARCRQRPADFPIPFPTFLFPNTSFSFTCIFFPSLRSPEHHLHQLSWLSLAVLSHIGWGVYPVFGRYLQVRSHPPLGTLQVLFSISFISIVLLAAWSLFDIRYRGGPIPFAGIHRPNEPGGRLVDFRAAKWSKLTGTIVMGSALAARALSNMYSARFTQARWVQMLNMLSPFFVGAVSHWVLKQPLADKFVPTLVLMTVGAGLTVGGGAANQSKSVEDPFDGWDVLGLTLALISAVSLAGYMLGVFYTKGVLTESEVLYVNYLLFVVVLAPFTFGLERGPWAGLFSFSAFDWMILFTYAVFIYLGSNLCQQMVIRALGAPVTAMFLSTRLVSACAFGYLLLGERITSPLEWIGLCLTGVTITIYLINAYRKSEAAKKAAALKKVQSARKDASDDANQTMALLGSGFIHSNSSCAPRYDATTTDLEAQAGAAIATHWGDAEPLDREALYRVRGPSTLQPRGLGYLVPPAADRDAAVELSLRSRTGPPATVTAPLLNGHSSSASSAAVAYDSGAHGPSGGSAAGTVYPADRS